MQNSSQVTTNNQQVTRWHSFESQDAINQAALKRVLDAAEKAIAARGSFSIVLAGGTTPKQVYELLRHANADWSKWHIYHNDDRCLPVDHKDRNSLMAREAWLNHVSVPEEQIHDIPAELGPVEGAKAYAETLKGVGEFDLVLLGLGEDGHTASLFPGHVWDDSVDAFPVFNSPKPPAERISISARRLSLAREVIFLVTGAGKQDAVDDWRKGVDIPATAIKPANGVDVFTYGVQLN
jgi:6-phosphogluconolactonase